MRKEYTATVFIIQEDKVLLIFHKKFQKWHPSGGHVLENESPHEAAIREAFEETGLHIKLLSDERIIVERPNAKTIPRPYACLIENISPSPYQDPHQHIDFIYVGYPIGGSVTVNLRETEGLKWFSINDIEENSSLFLPDVVDILRTILLDYTPLPSYPTSSYE